MSCNDTKWNGIPDYGSSSSETSCSSSESCSSSSDSHDVRNYLSHCTSSPGRRRMHDNRSSYLRQSAPLGSAGGGFNLGNHTGSPMMDDADDDAFDDFEYYSDDDNPDETEDGEEAEEEEGNMEYIEQIPVGPGHTVIEYADSDLPESDTPTSGEEPPQDNPDVPQGSTGSVIYGNYQFHLYDITRINEDLQTFTSLSGSHKYHKKHHQDAEKKEEEEEEEGDESNQGISTLVYGDHTFNLYDLGMPKVGAPKKAPGKTSKPKSNKSNTNKKNDSTGNKKTKGNKPGKQGKGDGHKSSHTKEHKATHEGGGKGKQHKSSHTKEHKSEHGNKKQKKQKSDDSGQQQDQNNQQQNQNNQQGQNGQQSMNTNTKSGNRYRLRNPLKRVHNGTGNERDNRYDDRGHVDPLVRGRGRGYYSTENGIRRYHLYGEDEMDGRAYNPGVIVPYPVVPGGIQTDPNCVNNGDGTETCTEIRPIPGYIPGLFQQLAQTSNLPLNHGMTGSNGDEFVKKSNTNSSKNGGKGEVTTTLSSSLLDDPDHPFRYLMNSTNATKSYPPLTGIKGTSLASGGVGMTTSTLPPLKTLTVDEIKAMKLSKSISSSLKSSIPLRKMNEAQLQSFLLNGNHHSGSSHPRYTHNNRYPSEKPPKLGQLRRRTDRDVYVTNNQNDQLTEDLENVPQIAMKYTMANLPPVVSIDNLKQAATKKLTSSPSKGLLDFTTKMTHPNSQINRLSTSFFSESHQNIEGMKSKMGLSAGNSFTDSPNPSKPSVSSKVVGGKVMDSFTSLSCGSCPHYYLKMHHTMMKELLMENNVEVQDGSFDCIVLVPTDSVLEATVKKFGRTGYIMKNYLESHIIMWSAERGNIEGYTGEVELRNGGKATITYDNMMVRINGFKLKKLDSTRVYRTEDETSSKLLNVTPGSASSSSFTSMKSTKTLDSVTTPVPSLKLKIYDTKGLYLSYKMGFLNEENNEYHQLHLEDHVIAQYSFESTNLNTEQGKTWFHIKFDDVDTISASTLSKI